MDVITSHVACARMEDENVVSNFPDIKGGRKINYEASPGPFSVTNGINTEANF